MVLGKFISFCFAGVSGAILELASFNIFFIFLSFIPSKILSLVLALTLNFTLNRNFTFKAFSERKRKQFARYMAVYSVAILVNLAISLLMNNTLGNGAINANLATVSGIMAAIPITFFGSLHWVFKDKIPKN